MAPDCFEGIRRSARVGRFSLGGGAGDDAPGEIGEVESELDAGPRIVLSPITAGRPRSIKRIPVHF